MAGDSKYAKIMSVSMTSGCLNQFKYTHLSYNMLVDKHFSERSTKILKSISENFPHCSVEIIKMGNEFDGVSKGIHEWPNPTYFRLKAASLLPNIDRVIYLDGDTLIHVDLNEFYNLNLDNLYYRGFPDAAEDPLCEDHKIYFCEGVLLMNLKLIREDGLEEKFLKYAYEHKYIKYNHQTILNLIGKDKKSLLPPEYGMAPFENIDGLLYFKKMMKGKKL